MPNLEDKPSLLTRLQDWVFRRDQQQSNLPVESAPLSNATSLTFKDLTQAEQNAYQTIIAGFEIGEIGHDITLAYPRATELARRITQEQVNKLNGRSSNRFGRK